jgi:hypothetical protein
MMLKATAYLTAGWAFALTAIIWVSLWPEPSIERNGILQWAVPVLMAASVVLFAGLGVWRSLEGPAKLTDANGTLPSDVALHLISKWGMRW